MLACRRMLVPPAGQSIAPRLACCLREEGRDDLLQIGTLAFRAVDLLRLVLLDGQYFVKFVMTLATDVFVEGHRSGPIRGSKSGFASSGDSPRLILLKTAPRYPFFVEDAPLFTLRNCRGQSFLSPKTAHKPAATVQLRRFPRSQSRRWSTP
jgi:hypothetical protein